MINIEIPKHSGELSIDQYKECPVEPGIYAFYSKEGELLYIGKAHSIITRVKDHIRGYSGSNITEIIHNVAHIRYWFISDAVDRDIYETYMINKLQPPWNCEKVYTYKTSRYDDIWLTDEQLHKRTEIKKENDQVYLNLNL